MAADYAIRLKTEVKRTQELYQKIKVNEKEVIKLKECSTKLEETIKKITGGFAKYGDNMDLLLNAKKNLEYLVEQLNSYLNIEEKIKELKNIVTEPSEIMTVSSYNKTNNIIHRFIEILNQSIWLDFLCLINFI